MYVYTQTAAKCDGFGSVGGTLSSESVLNQFFPTWCLMNGRIWSGQRG